MAIGDGELTSPKIIILNGVGSVGKSSAAKALQAITASPFMHVQGDAFLEMLPASMYGHPDGIMFTRDKGSDPPSIAIETGVVMHSLMRGMRRSVRALAEEGNNLIVDDVMLGAPDQAFYQEALRGLNVSFVGLFAPLSVLEQRERDRGDRLIGLARWQFERVHQGVTYDLEIDTSQLSSADCATRIAETFGLETETAR